MEAGLSIIRMLAMIVGAVLMIIFLTGQLGGMLAPPLQVFAEGGLIWFGILGFFILELVLRHILKTKYGHSGP